MQANITVKQYIQSILLLFTPFVLFFILTFLVIIPGIRESLQQDRREEIQELTNTVWYMLDYYNIQARAGSISLEEAQHQAINHIRHIRFGKDSKHFFWINDTRPYMIMHPYRPDLEGTSLENYTDPDGKYLFVEMVNTVNENGAGYVNYKWQWLDDPTIIAPKTSYVSVFKPWNWIIGTGLYIDTIDEEIRAITEKIFIYSIIVFAITGIFLGISLSHTIREERLRILSQNELAKSERKYRDLFDFESDALFLIDRATGKILEANVTAEKLYGFSHNTILEMIIDDLAFDSNRCNLTGDSTTQYHSHANGTTFPVEITTNTVTWDGHESYIASVRDISHRMQIEEALINSEREKGAILNSVTDLVVYHDTDLKIIWANRAYQELTNMTSQEIIGKFCHQIVHNCAEVCDGCPIIQARETDTEHITEMKMNDGQLYAISGFPVHGVDGEVTGIVEVMRNITQQRALENQLIHSQKMESIGRLAGGVAHDFNNLLTVILGNADFALLTHADDEDLTNRINEIRTAAERAGNLTRQLLAFSRHQITEPRIISVNTIVKELNKMLNRLIGENISLTNVLTDNVWQIKIDPVQLEQILVNLVVNAKDAMPEGGTITIETCNFVLDSHHSHNYTDFPPGEYVMIAVSDTGAGMTDDVKKNIFEPFFSTKEYGKGTGLGLSTCYGIARQNNGYIWVYSEPNVGTTFKIYFPKSTTDETENLDPSNRVSIPNGTERIIVVEDDPALRHMAVRSLTDYGYKVLEAEDGVDAIEKISNDATPIDLILTDIIMPRMGGKELAERIQSDNGSIKTLFMSGYTDESIISTGILDAGSAFIQKPFTPFQLAKKVRTVLDSVIDRV